MKTVTYDETQWRLVPVDRSYDMRAKAVIAFNTAEQAGKDRDDALNAAFRAELDAAPDPSADEQLSIPEIPDGTLGRLYLGEATSGDQMLAWAALRNAPVIAQPSADDDIMYEVYAGDELLAASNSPEEASRYATTYSLDGMKVKIRTVLRRDWEGASGGALKSQPATSQPDYKAAAQMCRAFAADTMAECFGQAAKDAVTTGLGIVRDGKRIDPKDVYESAQDREDAEKYRRLRTPEIENFLGAVENEALFQREQWGAQGDAGKSDADWFWLVGYLAGKAIRPDATNEKRLHHIITTAAACLNWHAACVGTYVEMRPGIADPDAIPAAEEQQ